MNYSYSLYQEKDLYIMVNLLEGLKRKNMVLQEILEKSLSYLKLLFDSTGDDKLMDVALLEIKAFLYMGGSYKSLEEKFNDVILQTGTDCNDLLLNYGAKQIPLTQSNIRSMIGRWMPSKENPMKIKEVVNDIIEKVNAHEIGTYLYQYVHKNGKWRKEDQYELVIKSDMAYFRDVGEIKYYILKKWESKDD